MGEEIIKRKSNRLQNYDYSSCGAYFLTVCTHKRRNYFWSDDRLVVKRNQEIELSHYGEIVNNAILNIHTVYESILVDHYVIMPDHVHLLLKICADEFGRPMDAPAMSQVVQQMKGYVTKQIGHSIWQKSFFDHVIRNSADYNEHIKYIYDNPVNWQFKK